MLLQFASASLTDHTNNHAKETPGMVRWAGRCSGVLVFQGFPGHCKTQGQILPYTKPQHQSRSSPTPAYKQPELCAEGGALQKPIPVLCLPPKPLACAALEPTIDNYV